MSSPVTTSIASRSYAIAEDLAVADGVVDAAVLRIDHERAAQRAVLLALAVLALPGDRPEVLQLLLCQIVPKEVPAGPSEAVEPPSLRVHRHGQDALASRGRGQILELLRRHVIGEEVPARIGLPTLRRNADLLHAVDDAVVADVGREVELAVPLDEGHMGLALDDRPGVLLAAGLGDVPHVLDLVGRRIVAEHLRADVDIRCDEST